MHGINCKVDCPAYNDDTAVAALDANSKQYCCDLLGVGCPPPPPTPAPTASLPSPAKPTSPVDAIVNFVISLLFNWDEIMSKPKVFHTLLMQTLTALLPKGVPTTLKSLLMGPIDTKSSTTKPADGSPFQKDQVSLVGYGQSTGTTPSMSTAAALRNAKSLGLKVHRVRHGTTLRTNTYSELGGTDPVFIDMQATGADLTTVQSAVDALSTSIKEGTTTNQGTDVALNGWGNGLQTGDVFPGTSQGLTAPPDAQMSQTPKAADSDSGSDMVLPLVLSGAGVLLCGGLMAFVVMKKNRPQSVSTHQFASAMPDAHELTGTQYTQTSAATGTRGSPHATRTVIESGRI